MSQRNVIVTGATGRQGRGFIHALLNSTDAAKQDDCVYRIWAITRAPSSPSAASLSDTEKKHAKSLVVSKGDLNDGASIRQVFADAAADGGIYGVFVVLPYPGLGKKPDNEERQGKMLADLALEFKARVFVYSSTIPPTPDRDDTLDKSHQVKAGIERYCEELGPKGLNWVFARPGFFMENFEGLLGKLAVTILSQGLKKGTELTLVASEDIGRVVAEIIKDPEPHVHQVVSITGSRETMANVMASHREVTGRAMPCLPSFIAKIFLGTSSGARKVVEQIERHYEARVSGKFPDFDVQLARGQSICELQDYRTWITGKQAGGR